MCLLFSNIDKNENKSIIRNITIYMLGDSMLNRAGQYIQALNGKMAYKAYAPNSLPANPPLEMDNEMVTLLSEAHSIIARLDTMAELLPDRDLFISAYVRKEALLSSQIEGTQATIEDILNPEISSAVNLEVADVVNYANALNFAINEMQKLPICNRLLCDVHKVLLSGIRGQEKNPGEFRKSQNWIGSANSTISTARYVPPTVENMHIAMSDLEKFINNYEMDALIKSALVHYQFETIHPFLDGNGRIGRMLITLMLIDAGILKSPVLYMSLFLKTNRIEYYDRLSEVRVKGNYEQWVKFFLQGIIATCKDSISTITQISELIKTDKDKISNDSAIKVYEYFKEHPIADIRGISNALNMPFTTASRAVDRLKTLNIINELTSKSRGRIFEYANYISILRSGT